jgi:hypothetical protein
MLTTPSPATDSSKDSTVHTVRAVPIVWPELGLILFS